MRVSTELMTSRRAFCAERVALMRARVICRLPAAPDAKIWRCAAYARAAADYYGHTPMILRRFCSMLIDAIEDCRDDAAMLPLRRACRYACFARHLLLMLMSYYMMPRHAACCRLIDVTLLHGYA